MYLKLIILTFIFTLVNSQTTTLSDPYCSSGIISKNVCCLSSCSQCGEDGCSNEDALVGDSCCINNIRENNLSCSEGEAPCVIDDDNLATNEEGSSGATLSMLIIIIIIICTLVLCLFINTGSNRSFR